MQLEQLTGNFGEQISITANNDGFYKISDVRFGGAAFDRSPDAPSAPTDTTINDLVGWDNKTIQVVITNIWNTSDNLDYIKFGA